MTPERSRPHAWVAGFLLAALPLAFDPGGYAPFGPVKWGLVTAGVVVAAGLLLGAGRVHLHRASAVGWLGVLVWGTVSALVGLDPVHAFIGTPERHLGLIAMVLFGLAFVVGLNSLPERRLLAGGATIGLAGMGVYAGAELMGTKPVDLAVTSARAGGPLGSPAYLGAAVTLLLPLVAAAAFDSSRSPVRRVGAGVAALLGLVALVGSQTRAALAGSLVGMALLLSFLLRRGAWRWALPLFVLLAAGVGLLTPAGTRFSQAFEPSSGATAGRLAEWRVGTRVLLEHPIVGVGPEGYRIAFPGAVDAGYERSYGRTVITDRAHSALLDTGLALGLPGLLAYLLTALWLCWRSLRALAAADPLIAGIGAGVVGYLVQQQFLFPLAEIDPLFWLLAGLVVAATSASSTLMVIRTRRLAAGAVVVGGMLLLGAGSLDLAADRSLAGAYARLAAGQAQQATRLAERAASLRPDSIRYWLGAADVASRTLGPQAGLARLSRGLEISPLDPVLRETRARLLSRQAEASGRPEDISAARTAWAGLVAGDPNNAQHHLSFGVFLARAGELGGAETEFLLAFDLAPRSAVPAINLSRIYLDQGRTHLALDFYHRAVGADPGSPGLVDLARLLEESGLEL
jgi:O-antigen ligase